MPFAPKNSPKGTASKRKKKEEIPPALRNEGREHPDSAVRLQREIIERAKDRSRSRSLDAGKITGLPEQFSKVEDGPPKDAKPGDTYKHNGSTYVMGKDGEWSKQLKTAVVAGKTRKDALDYIDQYITNEKTPEGGTISIPAMAGKKYFKDGTLASFSYNGTNYRYTTDESGGFDGYKNNDNEKYRGKEILRHIPWSYTRYGYYPSSQITWSVYSGIVKQAKSEYEHDPINTKLIQALWILGNKKMKTFMQKMSGNKLLKPIGIISASKFSVEIRSEYQYTTARNWFGYYEIWGWTNDNGYVVPLGMSDEYDVRVGIAKQRFRVLYDGVPTGMEWVDKISDMTVPTRNLPPKVPNKH